MSQARSEQLPVTWTMIGLGKEDQAKLGREFQSRQAAIAGKFATLPLPPLALHITVETEGEADASTWRMEGALYLTGLTLAASSFGSEPKAVLQEMLGGLAAESSSYATEPEAEQVADRREKSGRFLSEILQKWRNRGRSDAFLAFLRPLVASLTPHIQRQIQVHEIENDVPHGQNSALEIQDQLLADAWEQWTELPSSLDDVELKHWLLQLARSAVCRLDLGEGVQAESLDRSVKVQASGPESTWEDEAVDQVSYYEELVLSELIVADSFGEELNETELENKHMRFNELIGELPWQQRHALILNEVHGFEIDDIADFQNRSSEQVQADVNAAVAAIHRQFDAQRLEEVEEELELDAKRRSHH